MPNLAVVTIGVMAADVAHVSVSPDAVVRPCLSRGDRSDDRRPTHSQRDDAGSGRTKRAAERNQLNHTRSSMTHPRSHRP